MLKKMKKLLKINKDSVEIKPVLDGNGIRVSYFIIIGENTPTSRNESE